LNSKVILGFIIGAVAMAASAVAQENSNSELAKAAQNPIANLISLPFQNNTDFDWGPEEGTRNTLNVQPVWPFKISDNWNLIIPAP